LDALEWLAYTYEQQNEFRDALKTWGKLWQIEDLPEDKRQNIQEHVKQIGVKQQYGADATAESLVGEGQRLFKQRSYNNALLYFQNALVLEKDYPDAIEWIAYCYEKQNKLRSALAAWDAFLDLEDLPEEKTQLAENHIKLIKSYLEKARSRY